MRINILSKGKTPKILKKLITRQVSINKEIAVEPLFLSHKYLPPVNFRIHK